MNVADRAPHTPTGCGQEPLPHCLVGIDRYYGEKVLAHGATPQGVDWNSGQSQELRFDQLLKLCDPDAPFSINDIGCGYGRLYAYLKQAGADCDYLGVDISPAMIEAARAAHAADPKARFVQGIAPRRVADYSVASGIFNVRLQVPDGPWERWILEMLDILDESSSRGFAFNCLTKYSDPDRMRAELYYADPCRLFDHCKLNHSRNVALLHDYGLFEFTILVRK